jgi:hypothetical protein
LAREKALTVSSTSWDCAEAWWGTTIAWEVIDCCLPYLPRFDTGKSGSICISAVYGKVITADCEGKVKGW